MIAKVILTLEQDEQRGTNEAMEETIKLIAGLDVMPMMKIVFTLECEEVVAERYRATLRTALRERPIGIVAKFKTTTEEEVNRYVLPPVTPMDKAFGNLTGNGINSVTLSGSGRSATITAKTAGARVMDFLVEREQRAGDALENAATKLRAFSGAGDENLFDDDESDNDVTSAADDLFVNDDEQLEDRDGNRRRHRAAERQAWETR